ncbi:MAG: hypothetical protein M9953_12305 [Thermomicrobiales bacterium]|nr:hypothetical protein [Thermomicrobiales bacterium]MCO5226111.1 hypothetical protein [Thermomicrobiales bacterium]MCO5227680.1 hypothetical protein [Thermomicrobiales bacterium]
MKLEIPSTRVIGTVVCLPVRQLDISQSFYSAVFDFPELEASEGIVLVELPGLSLFLIEEQAFANYSMKAHRGVVYPGEGTGVILSCAITSREILDNMLDTAASNGGMIAKLASDDPEMGLYLGYFFDPDGHHWELAHSGKQN